MGATAARRRLRQGRQPDRDEPSMSPTNPVARWEDDVGCYPRHLMWGHIVVGSVDSFDDDEWQAAVMHQIGLSGELLNLDGMFKTQELAMVAVEAELEKLQKEET